MVSWLFLIGRSYRTAPLGGTPAQGEVEALGATSRTPFIAGIEHALIPLWALRAWCVNQAGSFFGLKNALGVAVVGVSDVAGGWPCRRHAGRRSVWWGRIEKVGGSHRLSENPRRIQVLEGHIRRFFIADRTRRGSGFISPGVSGVEGEVLRREVHLLEISFPASSVLLHARFHIR